MTGDASSYSGDAVARLQQQVTLPVLEAYVSVALTGVDAQRRADVDKSVTAIREVCGQPDVDISMYFPGDHTDPVRDADVSPEEVFRVDRARVKAADVLLVLAGVPSFGVGQELIMALESLLPIVVLVPEGVRLSRMVRGMPSRTVEIQYGDPEEMQAKLHHELRRLRSHLAARRQALTALEAHDFGSKLRSRREEAGLTREELANVVGMTIGGLALLEDSTDRQADPSLTQLRRLAAALGSEACDLI